MGGEQSTAVASLGTRGDTPHQHNVRMNLIRAGQKARERYEGQLRALQAENDNLRETLTSVRRQLREVSDQNAMCQQRVQWLQQGARQSESKMQVLREECAGHQTVTAALRQELQDLHTERARKQETAVALDEQHGAVRSKIADLQATVDVLRQRLRAREQLQSLRDTLGKEEGEAAYVELAPQYAQP